MSDLALSRAEEIRRLHEEIGGAIRTTLDKAIRVGELLTAQKAELKHGEWLPWLEANCGFTERTARNYIHVFANSDYLKTESVSDLTHAYDTISLRRKIEEKRERNRTQRALELEQIAPLMMRPSEGSGRKVILKHHGKDAEGFSNSDPERRDVWQIRVGPNAEGMKIREAVAAAEEDTDIQTLSEVLAEQKEEVERLEQELKEAREEEGNLTRVLWQMKREWIEKHYGHPKVYTECLTWWLSDEETQTMEKLLSEGEQIAALLSKPVDSEGWSGDLMLSWCSFNGPGFPGHFQEKSAPAEAVV